MYYLQEKLYQLVKVDKSVFDFVVTTSNQGLWCLQVKPPQDQWVSEGFYETFEDQIIEKKVWQALVKSKNKQVIQRSLDYYQTNDALPYLQFELCYTLQNGQELWATTQTLVTKDLSGVPVFLMGKVLRKYLKSPNHRNSAPVFAQEGTIQSKQSEGTWPFQDKELSTATKHLLEKTSAMAKLGAWELNLNTQQGFWSHTTRQIYEVPDGFVPTADRMLNFYKAESKEQVKHLIARCIRSKEVFSEELKVVTAKKREVWVRLVGQGEFEGEQCQRIYGTVQDINERKHQEEEAKKINTRLALATQTARVGIWEYDIVSNKLTWDDSMFELYGLKYEDFDGVYSAWVGLLHPDDVQRVEEEVAWAIEGKKEFDTAFRVVWQDSSVKYIKALARVHNDSQGSALFMIGTNWDITHEKLASEKLKEAKKQADTANKAKSEFLANMSHEIRTPLNGVIGFADLLQRSKLNETQQKYISTIYQSATSLLDIITNILDFSKIEAGKLDLMVAKTDLLNLSQQIINLIRYQAHKKDLEVLLHIDNDIPRFVWIDEVKMRQVLVNLLSNATKFTTEGEIELKIDLQERLDEEMVVLRFAVRDTGIGIAPENKGKIFEAFSQEDSSTTRRFGGTGLGLSISNKLLDLMGSRLLVESITGRGSVFYFDIPVKATVDAAIGKGGWQNIEGIEKVLIVDDNKNNRQILAEMLTIKDIEAEEVTNGLDALERLAAGKKYDIVFVDYHMPFMDGLETIKNIRQELAITAQDQPIVLFHSASDYGEFTGDVGALDIQQQLIKPVSIEQLFECLGSLHSLKEVSEPNVVEITQHLMDLSIKMLIVEDNAVNMQLSKVIVQGIMPDTTIVEACNGQEAIDVCKQELPDFIVMDIQMPQMNGYEATTYIRKIKGAENTPIIALTAGTLKGEKDRCLAAGMNDYISKPIVKHEFVQMINKWVISEKNMDTKNHFNQEALLETIGDNPKVKERIYAKTRAYLATVIPDIQAGIVSQNFDAVKASAHTLKGASRSMYLGKLAQMAEKLEGVTNMNPQETDELVEAIIQEINYIKTLI
ncbi:hybrid sensor histidine kinase/response regulator [Microscilla marina]|uniref:histidine kinase n=1 Tax=Microscilla marina ATCC 23134 TaxID=313606 RepID=A1ZWV1_MICM2|nr:hybrid sensor histidine kinase/response regulator [Microscilla marina]EAY25128.1 sensory box histidine kinase/response regulator [Microscilla marina ATCC 23134]